MSYMVRMLEMSNWITEDGQLWADAFSVCADGITKDLKTSDNTFSLWEIETLDELESIAISILTSRGKPQDLFVVAIPKENFASPFLLEHTTCAETAYTRYEKSHYDLLKVDLQQLKRISEIILSTLENPENVYELIYQQVRTKMQDLIAVGEIDKEKLKKDMKRNLLN